MTFKVGDRASMWVTFEGAKKIYTVPVEVVFISGLGVEVKPRMSKNLSAEADAFMKLLDGSRLKEGGYIFNPATGEQILPRPFLFNMKLVKR